MSSQTKETLEAALHAHFADEFNGAVATQYVIQVFGQRIDTDSGYYLSAWPTDQPIHITGGLIDYAMKRHTARMSDNITDPDDEDD